MFTLSVGINSAKNHSETPPVRGWRWRGGVGWGGGCAAIKTRKFDPKDFYHLGIFVLRVDFFQILSSDRFLLVSLWGFWVVEYKFFYFRKFCGESHKNIFFPSSYPNSEILNQILSFFIQKSIFCGFRDGNACSDLDFHCASVKFDGKSFFLNNRHPPPNSDVPNQNSYGKI